MKSLIASILLLAALFSLAALTVNTEDRYWRVQVFSDQTDPVIEVLWRTEYRDAEGNLIGSQPLDTTRRTVSQIAADEVTTSTGKTITGAEWAECFRLLAPIWRQQDASPPPES